MNDSIADDRITYQGSDLNIVLAGSWKLSDGLKSFADDLKGSNVASPDESIASSTGSGGLTSIRFQTDSLGEWDSSLLVYLQQAADYADDNKIPFDAASLPSSLRELLMLARAVPEVETRSDQAPMGPLKSSAYSLNLPGRRCPSYRNS
jgi:hypothetical protein